MIRFWPERRDAMMQYSRMIRGMKVALPILATLLIAAIFLADREEIETIFSPEEIARLGVGMRLENPHFSGITDSGDPFSLHAARATPDGAKPTRIELDRPKGTLTLPGGRIIKGSADRGLMLRDLNNMTLSRDVVITTSDGYRAETEEIVIDLASKEVRSPGQILGFGPNGTLEAGSFRIERKDRQPPDLVLSFEDGVRIVFIPEEAR